MSTILTSHEDDPAIGAVIGGCTLSALETAVQPIQVSPYQTDLAEQGFSVFTPFPLSQHAHFPFDFHLQVGWVIQKSFPPNFSSLGEGSSSRLNGARHRRTV